MTFRLVCSACKQEYDPASLVWRCTCGGLLDLAEFPVSFPLEHIRRRPATLWRYQEALPFTPTYTGWQTVTMGEGFTPLIPLKGHSSRVFFKLDYLMPTLSFKDRGAVVLIAKAQELGVTIWWPIAVAMQARQSLLMLHAPTSRVISTSQAAPRRKSSNKLPRMVRRFIQSQEPARD